jgi:hypothetical protein
VRQIGLVTLGIALLASLVAPSVPGAAEWGAPVLPAERVRAIGFQSGILHIRVERGAPDRPEGPLFYTTATEGASPDGLPGQLPTGEWAPGDLVVRTLHVINEGSLPVQLVGIGIINLTGSTRLAEALEVQVASDQRLTWGSVAELARLPHLFAGGPILLQPGERLSLRIGAHLPLAVGNAYQNQRIRFDLQVLGEQQGAPEKAPPPPGEQLG